MNKINAGDKDILDNYENDTHMDNQIRVVIAKARGEK